MSNSNSIPILTKCKRRNKTVETLSMIDCGAGGQFIDHNYAKAMGFAIQQLEHPLKALNVDGTENKSGRIKSFVNLEVTLDDKIMDVRFLVTGLGKQKILLGLPWLKEHNPNINWKTGEFAWRIPRRMIKIKRYHDLPRPLALAKNLA